MGHAVFTGFQCSGRLTADICGIVFAAGSHGSGATYYELFGMVLLLVLVCCTIAAFGSREYDPWTCFPFPAAEPLPILDPPDVDRLQTPLAGHTGPFLKRHLSAGDMPRNVARPPPTRTGHISVHMMPIMEGRQRRRRWDVPLPKFQVDAPGEEEVPGVSALMAVYEESALVVVVLVVCVFGWLCLHAQAFYWTLWLGLDATFPGTTLRLSFVSLAVQATTMILVAAALPIINAAFGDLPVFLFGHILLVVCLAATKFWVGPTAVLALGAGIGTAQVLHVNNSLSVCERMVDNARLRATVMGVVNCTMPVAQIVIALTSGPIISFFDGDVASFFLWTALVHCVVLAVGSFLLIIDYVAEGE